MFPVHTVLFTEGLSNKRNKRNYAHIGTFPLWSLLTNGYTFYPICQYLKKFYFSSFFFILQTKHKYQ